MSKTVPKVRFQGFVKDWDFKNMKSIANVLDGDRGENYPSEKDLLLNGHTAFLNAGNITKTGFSFNSIQYISENKSNLMGNGKLCLNDLIITSRGTLGNVALYDYEINSSIPFARINSGMLILRVFNEYSPYFLLQNLNSHIGKKQIKLMSFGSAQPQLTKKDVSNYKISIPESKEEQQKIGDFFKQLDDTIVLQQQLVEQRRQYKKAMLQKMFPQKGERVPKVRFDGFSGDWEEKFLGNEVEFYSGLTYSPEDIVTKNGTLVIRSSNVKNGELVDADNVYVDSSVVNSEKVIIGDIIVVVRNGSRNLIGKHAIVKKNSDNKVIGAFMTGIRSENSNFTNAILDTTQFTIEINKNLGATINQITTGNFKKMKFFFPSNKEQQKIGAFFKQLDDTIALHEKKLEDYKQLKKALLQRMFV